MNTYRFTFEYYSDKHSRTINQHRHFLISNFVKNYNKLFDTNVKMYVRRDGKSFYIVNNESHFNIYYRTYHDSYRCCIIVEINITISDVELSTMKLSYDDIFDYQLNDIAVMV